MGPDQDCDIALHFDKSCDRCHYNLPTAASNEIAVILPGSEDKPQGDRDIIPRKKDGSLMRIDTRHPFYVSLHYVLLFPTGQLGWHPHIEYKAGEMVPDEGENNEGQVQPSKKRKYITQSEYFAYHLHPRFEESPHIFMAGKLLQEYIVDAWALCEQACLLWIQTHQKELRAETYCNPVPGLLLFGHLFIWTCCSFFLFISLSYALLFTLGLLPPSYHIHSTFLYPYLPLNSQNHISGYFLLVLSVSGVIYPPG